MSKPGSAGVSSAQNAAIDRRERLRQLALEKIDLAKDPYFMRNHVGQYECKLCLTLHSNEGNYMAHTQGKLHQTNLARRAARDARETAGNTPLMPGQPLLGTMVNNITGMKRKATPIVPMMRMPMMKIGRPGYRVVKQRDAERDGQKSLIFEINYPEIRDGFQPRHRFMSAYEQQVDMPVDKNFQYLLFAAEPYETIAFKIPNWEIERGGGDHGTLYTNWDRDTNTFTLQLYFKNKKPESTKDGDKDDKDTNTTSST